MRRTSGDEVEGEQWLKSITVQQCKKNEKATRLDHDPFRGWHKVYNMYHHDGLDLTVQLLGVHWDLHTLLVLVGQRNISFSNMKMVIYITLLHAVHFHRLNMYQLKHLFRCKVPVLSSHATHTYSYVYTPYPCSNTPPTGASRVLHLQNCPCHHPCWGSPPVWPHPQ